MAGGPAQGVATEKKGRLGALGSQILSGHESGGLRGEVQKSHCWGTPIPVELKRTLSLCIE